LHRLGEAAGVTERQHDRVRPVREGTLDHVRSDGPGQESDPPRPVRPRGGDGELAVEPARIGAPAADKTETAAVGYRGGERTARGAAHRREDDRMLDGKEPGNRGP